MMIFQAEMNFDELREDKVPPPGGVHKEYVEERAMLKSPKQGAEYAQPFVSETTKYHYDIQGHLIAETNTSGQTLVEYIYLYDQPLAMVRTGEAVYYYHNDHLGTPQVLTDNAGAVAWKAAYNAFGNTTVDASSTITNNLRFPGQYYDAETGLHYNWNRYYDPNTGRYITADPIGLEGGVNLFSYVGNDPVNKADPIGLLPRNSIDYFGAEGNFLLGGGVESYACCEGKSRMLSVFTKVCFGAGFNYGVGFGTGINPPKGNIDCKKLFKGFSAEFGAQSYEASITPTGGSTIFTGGVGRGQGIKATVCYYIFLKKYQIGCCE